MIENKGNFPALAFLNKEGSLRAMVRHPENPYKSLKRENLPLLYCALGLRVNIPLIHRRSPDVSP